MALKSDTHKIGFRIRAQIGRLLASCINAWDQIRPPKDDYERWLVVTNDPAQPALEAFPHGVATDCRKPSTPRRPQGALAD